MENSAKIAACTGDTALAAFTTYGTAALPLLAIVAAIIAIWQIRSNAAVVRKATAHGIYHQYLKLALEHPILAYGKKSEIEKNLDEYGKYKWFVANMLFSFEEILLTNKNGTDWEATISSQLRRHAWHLSVSSSVRDGHWKKELKDLIDSAIQAHNP